MSGALRGIAAFHQSLVALPPTYSMHHKAQLVWAIRHCVTLFFFFFLYGCGLWIGAAQQSVRKAL
uniref:Uncharacterized protein n=1 Tax=Arundo donax TaxID=35708 RepID=A0A0A9ANN8_ARUDO